MSLPMSLWSVLVTRDLHSVSDVSVVELDTSDSTECSEESITYQCSGSGTGGAYVDELDDIDDIADHTQELVQGQDDDDTYSVIGGQGYTQVLDSPLDYR